MNFKRIFKVSALATLLLVSITGWAASSPLPMLQSTSDQMLVALQKNHSSLKDNPEVVHKIIRTILLPHVDSEGMARSVIGRDAWSKATSTQRQHFIQEFITLLIRTYASAFAAYDNQTVQFLPMRGDVTGKSRVQINSKILQQGGPAIAVSYRLILLEQEWKVYDFSVDGVSMLESFRSQFAAELSQGNIDRVIQTLSQHNSKHR